jgi:uncharacterized protein (TIGR02466 family)
VPIENWFAVPIYFSKLEGDAFDQVQAEIGKAIESVPELNNPWDDTVQTNFSYKKHNNFLEKTPFFAGVVAEEVMNYLREVTLRFELKGLDIKESWINLYPKYAYQNYHLHSFSDISGSYYFATNEEDGDLKFKAPSSASRYSKFPVDPSEVVYKPEVGKLILFPSYLEHAVLMNKTDHQRVSVAFNISLY